ncbi:cysteine-rich secretory protein LCCL domain-containing 2-like [Ostrea edulis]|uniref:cysteine-rich secretory protein LCCL domain-containing 2-like n=1 Tax=Ostrea edulis TaxID=37623 RepID=UPI0020965BAA|nr:cysteine-rich secretory protein LCCL domain-containing 2-like [Ostrea edulis]
MVRMRMSNLLIAVCLMFVRGNSKTVPVGPYKDQLLNLHNAYRLMQGAADMQALVWDDQLSKEAQAWTQRCVFEHQKKGRGENLAYDTHRKTNEELINSSMKAWYDEIKDYNYYGKQCYRSCHYTQIVWAKTRKVGCAIEKCDSMSTFGRMSKNAWYLACFYDPMGNNMSEYPYQKGEACTKCFKKQSCEKGLCTGVEACEDYDENCNYWATNGECKKNPKFMSPKCRKSCGICH